MAWIEQVRKIDKKRQKLHALECATGCTSWICNACICFGPLALYGLFCAVVTLVIPTVLVQDLVGLGYTIHIIYSYKTLVHEMHFGPIKVL